MRRRILFCEAIDPRDTYPFPTAAFGYLSASIRRAFGPDVWDIRVAADRVEREIDLYQPDAVGISSMTPNWARAVEIARIAAERGIPVMVGGVHITALPDSLTRGMQVGVIGEGENTIIDLLCLLISEGALRPESLAQINGICYRDAHGALHLTEAAPLLMPLDSIGRPAIDVLPFHDQPYLLTSRGCASRCNFCSSSSHWRKYRAHSAVYTVRVMEETARRFNTSHLWIMDEQFLLDVDRLKEIAGLMHARRLDSKLTLTVAGTPAHHVTQETLDILRAMNVVSLGIGFESASPRVLQFLKGDEVTVQDNRRAILRANLNEMPVFGYFIVGTPGETNEDVRMTYDFVRQYLGGDFLLSLLTPYPGTPLWSLASQEGLVHQHMDFSRLNANANLDPERAVIMNQAMDTQEIKRWVKAFRALQQREGVRAFLRDAARDRIRFLHRCLSHPVHMAQGIIRAGEPRRVLMTHKLA